MKEQYNPKTVDGKFMANMKSKVNTKEKDPVKVEKTSMKAILQDITQVPSKLSMVGSPDMPSEKKAKSGENQLHTGKGKQEFKSTMDKSY